MNKSKRKFPPSTYFSIIGQKGLGTKARTSAPKMRFTIAQINPPASEASREVANLTERKNTHTPVYGVKEFVFLSVSDMKLINIVGLEW